jgi:hypothetical protein
MSLNTLMRKVFLLSALFLVLILFSCKKDGKLSPDFEDGNLSVEFTDTFSLKTSVVEDPSGRTDVAVHHLLGAYNDPIFGVKSSSIYTNVGLAGSSTDFGGFLTIDSIVLVLDPIGYYGNSNSSYTVNVFELSSPLSTSTGFYSNTLTSTEPTLLGSNIYTPSSTDSILTAVDNVMHKPHLRVNLNDPTLISNITTKVKFTDNADFNTVLKGLHIVTTDTSTNPSPIAIGDGAISYFDLSSSFSGVIVYYSSSLGNNLQEKFIVNSDVKSYARFINDYTGTDVEKHINDDPSKNINRTYVSTMKGVRTKIEIPNIKELTKEGDISINKAQITFTLEDGSDTSPDEILSSLTLTGIDSEGNAIRLLDDPTLEGSDHYGGSYNFTTKSFTFNITKHIYQLIKSTTADYGMYLTANGSVTTANRIVLNSENSSISKIKLEITYSKL